jgi:hypothetical protein
MCTYVRNTYHIKNPRTLTLLKLGRPDSTTCVYNTVTSLESIHTLRLCCMFDASTEIILTRYHEIYRGI